MNKNLAMILLVAAIGASMRDARAEVVCLSDGRILQGEIVEHDELGILFRIWDTDGEVKLPWAVMLEREQTELKKKLGYIIETEDTELEIEAQQVTLVNGAALTGLEVEGESTDTQFALRSQGTTLRLERDQIDSIDPISLPILQVLAQEEVYDYLLGRFQPDGPESNYRLADALEKAFAYEEARMHYLVAAETGGGTYAELTASRIEACDDAIANAELRGKLREIELLLGQHRYVLATQAVEALAQEYEGTGQFDMGTDEDRGPGLKLLARVEDEKEKWLVREVARLFYLEMRDIAGDYVAGRLESFLQKNEDVIVASGGKRIKPGFSDAQGFARGQMMQEILVRVKTRLGLPSAASTLAADVAIDASDLALSNAKDFPEPGDKRFPEDAPFLVQIDEETIQYEKVAGRKLVGLKRGVNGTQPRSHERGAAVVFGTSAEVAQQYDIDVRPYFDARKKSSHRSSYGNGTYMVDMRGREIVKAGQKPRQQTQGGASVEDLRRQLRGGAGGGGGKKLRDPEEWWGTIDSSTKRSWLIAAFAEAQLTVTGINYSTCSTCGGRGAITTYGAGAGGGDTQSATQSSGSSICSRCSGPGADRIVSFY